MNEHDPSAKTEPQLGGFVDESIERDSSAAKAETTPGAKRSKKDELRANFASVFGHGIGKFALIAVALVVLIMLAFALRGMNKPAVEPGKAQVDVPNAPQPRVSVAPIDEREAQRRDAQAAMEAEQAARRGQSYQPDFNPAVIANGPRQANGGLQPNINIIDGQSNRPVQPPVAPAGAVPVTIQAAQPNAQLVNQVNQQQQQEERRLQAEYEKQLAAREMYLKELRGGVKDQVEELLGGKGKGDGGIRGSGTYTMVNYMPRQAAAGVQGSGAGSGIGSSAPAGLPTSAARGIANTAGSKGVPVFKAGKAIFATLDSEVNTDDGGEVFATVRGGKYDGSKLIGKIEQAPRNIRLRFSILSPQDDRPSLNINAIAIREDDAKQGVAESIDHHTLERYTALFAGSILSGVARAAAEPQGELIYLPNGQVVVSQDELSNKRIAMYALGEIGTNAGAEVRKKFSQPPTYITPANKGIGVIFLSDVNER